MENTERNANKPAVDLLIAKAADAHDSADALRFSQAACNAANAMCALKVAEAAA